MIRPGDQLVVSGRREYVISEEKWIGAEVSDTTLTNFAVQVLPVVVNRKGAAGERIGKVLSAKFMHGVNIRSIVRAGVKIPVPVSYTHLGRRGPRRPAGFSGAQFQIRSGAASLGRAAEQCGCTRGGESRGGDRAAANRRAGTFGPVRHAAGQVVDSSRKLKESEDQPSLSFFIFLRYSRRYFLP